jgi:hypothetical protein
MFFSTHCWHSYGYQQCTGQTLCRGFCRTNYLLMFNANCSSISAISWRFYRKVTQTYPGSLRTNSWLFPLWTFICTNILAALIHMRYIRYIILETMSHSVCFLDRGGLGCLNNELGTSLSPIRCGFASGFVIYTKGCTRLAAASD